ncbi:MarC family protein [Acidiferrobacter sp.]|uniref:MarC family protein n=1 Tax=Acidiferrobacter sp. TaxID=1872107 RepID=UPI0026175A48|nr:MarC family protein [Acidiferrobacter sp.]
MRAYDIFLTFFVVVDPVGLVPLFGALTAGTSHEYRRRMAVKGVLIAALVLLFFAVSGFAVLRILGIGLAAFRIAGGILLFLLAIDMVFARHSGLRTTTSRETEEARGRNDISVFPLAIPLIAGPGALTSLLLMLSAAHGRFIAMGLPLGILALVLVITLVVLLLSERILALMGETGANVVTRLLGVVLTALAVQYVLTGIRLGLLYRP